MSIEKTYSSSEMTRVELGKYVPKVKAEIDELGKQQDQAMKGVGSGFILVAVASGFAMSFCLAASLVNAPVNALNLSLAFGPPVPLFVAGCVVSAAFGIKAVNVSLKIDKEETEVGDRTEQLQNEANRLWVKREQIRAMQDNNNAKHEFDQKLVIFEEKFGIRPNMNSEEEYLAYWANSK